MLPVTCHFCNAAFESFKTLRDFENNHAHCSAVWLKQVPRPDPAKE